MFNFLFNYIFRKNVLKISILPPQKAEILIFDISNEYFVSNYLKLYKTEVLNVRKEKVNLICLFIALFKKNKLAEAYIDTYISFVNPKILITFIDNNLNFYRIKKRHPNIITMFIQNGWRSFYSDVFENLEKSKGNYSVDFMCVYGKVIANEYSKYIKGKIIKIGSIKNNSCKIINSAKTNKIIFISQFIGTDLVINEKLMPHEKYIEKNDKKILISLLKYAKKFNKQVCIMLRQKKNNTLFKKEVHFYNTISSKLKLIENNSLFTPYKYLDKGGVIVAVDSTLGYESIARGNPSLILSGIRGEPLKLKGLSYGWPGKFEKEGIYWLDNFNEKKIFKKLNFLFQVSKNDFINIIKSDNFFSQIMTYDKNNSKLLNLINEILIKK